VALSHHQAETGIVKLKVKFAVLQSLLEARSVHKDYFIPENYSGVADVLQELQLKIQHGH
jgi:hypothetical protein